MVLGEVLGVALSERGADIEGGGELDGIGECECEPLAVELPQAVKVAATEPLPAALPQAVAVAVTDALCEPLPMDVPECAPEPEAAAVPEEVPVPPPPAMVAVAHAVAVLDMDGVLDAKADTVGAVEEEWQEEGDAVRKGEGDAEGVGVPLENRDTEFVGVPLAEFVAQYETDSEDAGLAVGEPLEVPVLRRESVGALDALADELGEKGAVSEAVTETVPLGEALRFPLALTLALAEGLGVVLEQPVALGDALEEGEVALEPEKEGLLELLCERGADAVCKKDGSAEEVAKDVTRALSENCADGVENSERTVEAVRAAVGVTSSDGLAVREPAAAVAERAGEGVPGGEAVDEREPATPVAEGESVKDPVEEVLFAGSGEGVPAPLPLRAAEGEKKEAVKDAVPHAEKLPAPPLAVALTFAEPDGVAHGEAGIDAELAPDTVALSVFPGESESTTEGDPEEEAQALPEGALDSDGMVLGEVLGVALSERGADIERGGELDGTGEGECVPLPVELQKAVGVTETVLLAEAVVLGVGGGVPDGEQVGEPVPLPVPVCEAVGEAL